MVITFGSITEAVYHLTSPTNTDSQAYQYIIDHYIWFANKLSQSAGCSVAPVTNSYSFVVLELVTRLRVIHCEEMSMKHALVYFLFNDVFKKIRFDRNA